MYRANSRHILQANPTVGMFGELIIQFRVFIEVVFKAVSCSTPFFVEFRHNIFLSIYYSGIQLHLFDFIIFLTNVHVLHKNIRIRYQYKFSSRELNILTNIILKPNINVIVINCDIRIYAFWRYSIWYTIQNVV